MDNLLKSILNSSGISGYEKEIGRIMETELKKSCNDVRIDTMGNVIGKKGERGKRIMLAAHMDEIGLMVKHITKEGYVYFIKVGGIDDKILLGQRVVIKSKNGDVPGIIGTTPPHLQKNEDKKNTVKYEDMFIDIGCKNRDEAWQKVAIADQIVFEPNSGVLNNSLYFGKSVDNRVGCYALLKIMERINIEAQIFAVATVQEEVGLKGARTSSYGINPDFSIVLDTTIAGDTPHIQERESALKLGEGAAITVIEASGRGVIVSESIKDLLVETAKANNIKYQIDVIEGGVTDGAIIYINREGIPTGVLSIPCRYIHSPSGVFSIEDLNSAVELTLKVMEKVAK